MGSNCQTGHLGTVHGEAQRVLLSSMTSHDKKFGLGGYYLTKADMKKLRKVLGQATEMALTGAGFQPDPYHPGRWWTGSRAPGGGDPCRIRFLPPFPLLDSIVRMYGGVTGSRGAAH